MPVGLYSQRDTGRTHQVNDLVECQFKVNVEWLGGIKDGPDTLLIVGHQMLIQSLLIRDLTVLTASVDHAAF